MSFLLIEPETEEELEEEGPSICLNCIHYDYEIEGDGYEEPEQLIPLCGADEGRNNDCYSVGYIENWPIKLCDYFESK